jgi:hypothetical protein
VLPIQDAANALFAAIASDLPVQLTGTTGPGSDLDPNATAPPVDPNASGSPSDPATPPLANVVQLPSTITGQSSAQQTCSKGQTYRP